MASTPYIGQIQAFSFNFAPRGWALCTGQLLPINQNQALFALLGTYYGGDARTTFGLPNLQGRAAKGQGQGGSGLSPCVMGQVNGAEHVTLTVTQLPSHNHTLTVYPGSAPKVSSQPGTAPEASPGNATLGQLSDPSVSALNYFYNNQQPDTPLNSGYPSPALANAGGSLPVDIMQPFLVINYCIALLGLFPSRN